MAAKGLTKICICRSCDVRALVNRIGCTLCRNQTGFTLIEILLVLLIVTIMSGLVVINLPSFASDGDIDDESDRMRAVIEMARDEALVTAEEFGMRPSRTGYEFFIYDEINQSWTLVDEAPFKQRALPQGFTLTLRVEGDELQLGNEGAPPLLILSSGEMTAFELSISSGQTPAVIRTLRADGYGGLDWQSDEDR